MATEVVTGALVRAEPLLPMDIDAAQHAMTTYQQLTGRLLTSDDWQNIGRDERFVKRSGWSKLATFYGVSTAIVSEAVERDDDGNPIRARFTVRATHPNGRYEEGDGACSIDESRFASRAGRAKLEHDLPATARTRARNRAIADLIGFGQVSAEEVDGTDAVAPETPELPQWARPMGDPSLIVPLLVSILQAAGVERPGQQVNAIGQILFDTCDGTVPQFVQVVLEQIVSVLPEPAPQGEPEVEPTPQPQPET